MALAIATNNAALNAAASASSVNRDMETSMARLSTGKRINSASDDAAGVAISSRLSAEIRGTDQAIRNSLDGQALIDTAEGAHKEIENILQRMREVAIQAANDTNNHNDRMSLQAEVNALMAELERINSSTAWGGQSLMGKDGSKYSFQVGAGTSGLNQVEVALESMSTDKLFPRVYENDDFSITPIQNADGTISIPGWSIFEEQLFLGSNGNPGTSMVAGYSTPSDPTAFPGFGGNTSLGDGNIPSNTPWYDASIEGDAIRLQSQMTTAAGGDVVRGPYIVSNDSTFIPSGAQLSFDW